MTLYEYLESVKDKPYRLGEHDCLIFSNQCWLHMYGEYWSEDWLNRYLGPKDLRREYGYQTVEDGLDSKLIRSPETVVGSLVTVPLPNSKPIGMSLGICLGTRIVFVGTDGLVYLPTAFAKNSWIRNASSSV